MLEVKDSFPCWHVNMLTSIHADLHECNHVDLDGGSLANMFA